MTTFTTQEIAKSIYVINRHAKTAKTPHLYQLKSASLEKLLKEGRAKKVGIHESPSRTSMKRLDTLIAVENYFFHTPASKEDKQTLEFLGPRDQLRNPDDHMSLNRAKSILQDYSGYTLPQNKPSKFAAPHLFLGTMTSPIKKGQKSSYKSYFDQ